MPGFLATVWVSTDDGVGAVVLTIATAGLPVAAVAADLLGMSPSGNPGFRPLGVRCRRSIRRCWP